MQKCLRHNCNKEFKERSNKLYCSRRCKTISRNRVKNRPYTLHKKEFCEYCGFIPIHPCQLDVDHIDGDHNNNDESNLRTLCANCHRLKTYKSKDWK